MASVRQAILEDRFPQFLFKFFDDLYGDRRRAPDWAITALKGVGVDLLASREETSIDQKQQG